MDGQCERWKASSMSERKSENSFRMGKLLKKNAFLGYVKVSFVYEYVGLIFFSLSKGEKLVIPEISHNRMTELPVEGFNVP